jgi:hypothetical protein
MIARFGGIAVAACALIACAKLKSQPKPEPEPSLRDVVAGTTCGEGKHTCEPGDVRNARIALPQARFARTDDHTFINITVDANEVLVVGDPYPIARIPKDAALGFSDDDKAHGRADRLVTPLMHALEGARKSPNAGREGVDFGTGGPRDVVIVADRATPYRMITEILYTSSFAELGTFRFAVSTAGGVGVVDLPDAMRSRHAYWVGGTPRLFHSEWGHGTSAPGNVAVRLGASGIEIVVGANRVGKGCNGVGEGPAIPRTPAGEFDFKALAACAQKIHAETKEEDNDVRVGGENGTPWGDVVTAIDAVHSDASGATLYDQPFLIVPETALQ